MQMTSQKKNGVLNGKEFYLGNKKKKKIHCNKSIMEDLILRPLQKTKQKLVLELLIIIKMIWVYWVYQWVYTIKDKF